MRQLKIALLCDYDDGVASTILDHLDAFDRFSMHDFTRVPCMYGVSNSMNLANFDGIVIHYSLAACIDAFLSPIMRIKIRYFTGYKLVYVQDDYRFIDDTVATLAALRIDVLFALTGPDIIDQVYPPRKLPGVRRETTLAGYVPHSLLHRPVPAVSERRIDVGYRARRLPAWLGSYGQEKSIIADRFQVDAKRFNLSVDISCAESDRMYGERWIRFLSDCKAVLGTESGASVFDFTGEIQRRVEAHVAAEPDVTFEKLRDLYFRDVDGRIVIGVISPRCFEAASLRTLMIMYSGEYSGRMQPWRHYVPLSRDHSNIDEVVSVLRNHDQAQDIVDRAYREVACAERNSYAALARQFDGAIMDLVRDAPNRGSALRANPFGAGDTYTEPPTGEQEIEEELQEIEGELEKVLQRNRTVVRYRRLATRLVQYCLPVLGTALRILGRKRALLVREGLRRRWRLWLMRSPDPPSSVSDESSVQASNRLYRLYHAHRSNDRAWNAAQTARDEEVLRDIERFVQAVPELWVTVRSDRLPHTLCLEATLPNEGEKPVMRTQVNHDIDFERVREVFWCPVNLRGFGQGRIYNERVELRGLQTLLSTGDSEGVNVLQSLRVGDALAFSERNGDERSAANHMQWNRTTLSKSTDHCRTIQDTPHGRPGTKQRWW